MTARRRPNRRLTALLIFFAAWCGLLVWNAAAQAAVDSVTLVPETARKGAGSTHTLTATATSLGQPTAGAEIVLEARGVQGCPDFCAVSSGITAANGQATISYYDYDFQARTDDLRAFADLDSDYTFDAGEPSDTASVEWFIPPSDALVLTPETETNNIGTEHTATATVTNLGQPVQEALVVFQLRGPNSFCGTEFCTYQSMATDATGQATLRYTGTRLGTDEVRAFVEQDGNFVLGPTEPSDIVTKTWVTPASDGIVLTPETATNRLGTEHTLTATVTNQGQPVNEAYVGLQAKGPNGCVDYCTFFQRKVTNASGTVTFTYTGRRPGTDDLRAYIEKDGDFQPGPTEQTDTATKTWTVPATDAVTLTPETASNPLESVQTFTARATNQGQPVEGAFIVIQVKGPNCGSGVEWCNYNYGPADANGELQIQLYGFRPGTTEIRAFLETDGDLTLEAGELSDSSVATWTVPPTDSVTLEPATATNNINTEQILTATVRNQNLTVQGAFLVVQVRGPSASSYCGGGVEWCTVTSQATDANGQVVINLYAYSQGTDEVRAFSEADGDLTPEAGEPIDFSTIEWIDATAPDSLVLLPETDRNPRGTSHTVTATVTRQTQPISGATVLFQRQGPNAGCPSGFCFAGSQPTDANGVASFTYTGNSFGVDTIRAFVDRNFNSALDPGEVNDSSVKTWYSNTTSSVSLAPGTATNEIGSPHTVTASAFNPGFTAGAGALIVFEVKGPNGCVDFCQKSEAIANAAGQATFTYTGTVPGTDTIRAYADNDGDSTLDPGEPISTNATKRWITFGDAISLSPASATNEVATQHTVTATITKQGSAANGAPVVFQLRGPNGPQPSCQTTFCTVATTSTNPSGQATYTFTGNTAGLNTIRAFTDNNVNGILDAGEQSATATKEWRRSADVVSLAPPTATNATGTSHAVTATVTNGGAPVAGTTVIFAVSGAHTINPATCGASCRRITDANGRATFSYTGSQSGNDTIRAFADGNVNATEDSGEPSGTAAKTWVTRALSLEPSTGTSNVGTEHTLTATVTEDGAPMAGVNVDFEVYGANECVSTETCGAIRTTDAAGKATLSYTGFYAGADDIFAYADADGDGSYGEAGEPTGHASKTWIQPSQLALTPANATNDVGASHTVTARLTTGGAAVSGARVVFEVFGPNDDCQNFEGYCASATTNASGDASFAYTGGFAGLDTIYAFADANGNSIQDGPEVGATAQKMWVSNPAASIEVPTSLGRLFVTSSRCVSATARDSENRPSGLRPVGFSVAGPNATTAPVIRNADTFGRATFCYTGANDGTDTITVFGDNNSNGTREAGEPASSVDQVWRPAPSTLQIDPASGENQVGTQHTLTATVADAGGPVDGAPVVFRVNGPNFEAPECSFGEFGDCYAVRHTDANGRASFTYTGDFAGRDTILAFVDLNGDRGKTANEVGASATKDWVTQPTGSGTLEVRKQLIPASDPGRFDLQIDGATEFPNAGDGDTTGEKTVNAGSHTVGETAGTTPSTSLADYVTTIICRGSNGNGSIIADREGAGPLGVNVANSADVVCTITNRPDELLTVQKAGSGGGTVVSNPTGINCGTDCSHEYAQGSSVTLAPIQDDSSTFTGWSGGGCSGTGDCTVSMDAARTVTATFDGETLGAVPGDDQEIIEGDEASFQAGASQGEIAAYEWDFGDGQTATGKNVTHTYSLPGDYEVILTVIAPGGARSSRTSKVKVKPAGAGGLAVTVRSKSGTAIAGADVVVIASKGAKHSAKSGSNGTATLRSLDDGTYAVYAVAVGYLPAAKSATVKNGAGTVTIELDVGKLASSVVQSRRLTADEISAAGIDPNDPANQHVISFTLNLCFSTTGSCTDDGSDNFLLDALYGFGEGGWHFIRTALDRFGPGSFCDSRFCSLFATVGGRLMNLIGIPDGIDGDDPTIFWMIVPGEARFLKEFFNVQMAVTNLADAPFEFQNGQASLQIPSGLSLAPTAEPQSTTVPMDDIPGGETRSAEWIVRGDVAGLYDLRASYSGTLFPFDRSVLLSASTTEPLRVWGTNAAKLIFDVDSQAYQGHPYRVAVTLENVTSDATIYNAAIELSQGSGYIFSPGQQLVQTTPAIPPGGSFTANFILLPDHTGTLDLSSSFASVMAGASNGTPDLQPTHDPLYTPDTAPIFTALDNGTLTWEPMPNAVQYELHSVGGSSGGGGGGASAGPVRAAADVTDFPTENPSPEPIAVTSDTTIQIPNGGGEGKWYAINTVLADGTKEMFHPLVEATTPSQAAAGVTGTTLEYIASPGKENRVGVSLASGTYTITDSSETIAAGAGCTSVSATEITCSAAGVTSVHVDAGDGNDTVTQSASTPVVIDGGPGDDTLTGSSGNDALNGNDGNDRLIGGPGRDGLTGGADTDVADYSARAKSLTVTLDGVANDGTGSGNPGEADNVQTENVTGGSAADRLTGDANANSLNGNGGDDALNGGDGDDSLTGGSGNDSLNGQVGTDLADYGDHSSGVTVTLDGAANDGSSGETDNVQTENVTGGSGSDTLYGDGSANALAGSGGNDSLNGSAGNDQLDGGAGDDTIASSPGRDLMVGGTGIDTAIYSGRNKTLTVTLDGVANDGTGKGMPGEADNVQTENVTGGNAADRLTGNSQANRLNGGPGADVLIGLDGNDRLLANDGVADTTLDCDGGSSPGTADSAVLDLLDPDPLGCETFTRG